MGATADNLQSFRLLLWPFLVGVTSYHLVRLVLMFLNERFYLSKVDHLLCISTGFLGLLVGAAVSIFWDNGSGVYWLVFTLGLLLMTVTLVVSTGLMIVQDHQIARVRRPQDYEK